jgi:tetratricopeptide (TPR) repeat protein
MHDDRVISLINGLLALVLAIGGCGQLSPEAQKAEHFERGQAYFEKGQFQEVLIEFKNVVQIDPKDADGHYRLALTYLELGSLPHRQTAFSELTKTIDLDPANRDAQLKLGELYLLNRDPAQARERAKRVLASAPHDADGLRLRRRSLIAQGDFDRGIADLKTAIAQAREKIPPYLDVAQAFLLRKDHTTAESMFRQALEADPRSIAARLAFGDFRLLTGKPVEAEAEYMRALELEPDNEALHLKLAGFYQLIGKWPEATAAYQKLTSLWAGSITRRTPISRL